LARAGFPVKTSATKQPSNLWLAVPYVAFGIGIPILHSAWIALVGYHLLILLVLALHRDHWQLDLLWTGFNLRRAALIPLIMLVVILPVVLLGQAKGYTGDRIEAQVIKFGLAGISAPLFIAYFVLINPLFEELFWRQLFGNPSPKPAWQDLAFGAFHIFILLPLVPALHITVAVICISTLGWHWRTLRNKHGGLSLPVLSHMGADAAASAIVVILFYS